MGSPVCTLGNLCDALLKYYNTSILDHPDMNSELKKACFEEAEKCANTNLARKDRSLKRTVLSELIRSHEHSDINKPYADFIAGPKSLTLQWSSYYKKLIYIFGENHFEEYYCPILETKIVTFAKDDCPTIEGKKTIAAEDYIYALHQDGDMFSDVYVETGAFFKKEQEYTDDDDSRLSKLRNRFTRCLSKDANSHPDCRKGRVHYIDIRQIEGMEYGNITHYTTNYIVFCDEPDKEEYLNYLVDFFSEDKVLHLIEDVSNMDSPEEFITYLKKEFDENYLFEKELRESKLSEPNIKDKISSFIDENIKKYGISFIQSIIDGIKSLKEVLEIYKEDFGIMAEEVLKDPEHQEYYKSFKNNLDEIFKKLITLESLLVDGYLLARVFKNFNIDVEDETKRRSTDEPYEPHNIIIYAGDGHSNRYREFLKELGFELIAITGEDWRDKDSTNPYKKLY